MKNLDKFLATSIVLLVIAALPLSLKAQESKILVGGGINYTSNISSAGLSVKGVYLIDETWEGAAAFTYLFENDYTSWSMLDLDGHYVFKKDETMTLYALGGLNFTFWKVEFDYGYYDDFYDGFGGSDITGNEVGINLGAGGRYDLSEKLSLVGEAKFTVGGFNFLTLGVGVLYKL